MKKSVAIHLVLLSGFILVGCKSRENEEESSGGSGGGHVIHGGRGGSGVIRAGSGTSAGGFGSTGRGISAAS